MPSINKYAFAALAFTALVQACDYARYLDKPMDDYGYRRCTVGCDDMTVDDPHYDCCLPMKSGSTIPASCTAVASSASAAGVTTCTYTSYATTDSTGMAAPTDYKPAFPTAPVATAVPTSDTAGESYSSIPPNSDGGLETSSIVANAVTEWVTETASPDCTTTTSSDTSVYTTPAAVTTSSPPTETTATPAYTCACSDTYTSAVPPPAETSDTHGESYSSESPSYSAPADLGSKPGPGDDLSGLDRRLVQRTETQYTCECPAAGTETSDTAGQSWSETSAAPSSSWSAPPAEATEDCDDEYNADLGSKPDGEVHDNGPAKRFLPLEYSIGHPIQDRAYGPPPPSFEPDDEVHWRRTEPTESVTDNNSVIEATVTSTTTVTGSCPATEVASLTSSVTAEVTDGAVHGAISGQIGSVTVALTGDVTLPTSDTAGESYSSDSSSQMADLGSHPTGEVVDNYRKRKRS